MKKAISATTQCIEKRSNRFKFLIIVLTAIAFLSTLCSIIFKSPSLLALLLLFFPACTLFIYLDTVLLNQWQARIFRYWLNEMVDIYLFLQTIPTIRMIPSKTLYGMLSNLPVMDKDIDAKKMLPEEKKFISTTFQIVGQIKQLRSALVAAISVIGVVSVICSIIYWTWIPLLSLLFTLPAWIFNNFLVSKKTSQWKVGLDDPLPKGNYLSDLKTILEKIDWKPISKTQKNVFFIHINNRIGY